MATNERISFKSAGAERKVQHDAHVLAYENNIRRIMIESIEALLASTDFASVFGEV